MDYTRYRLPRHRRLNPLHRRRHQPVQKPQKRLNIQSRDTYQNRHPPLRPLLPLPRPNHNPHIVPLPRRLAPERAPPRLRHPGQHPLHRRPPRLLPARLLL